MKFRPIGSRLLVKRLDSEDKTPGGIWIPPTAQEKPVIGLVEATGPGSVVGNTFREVMIKKGDKVIFGKYTGNEVKIDDVEYIIMNEEDVLGVIEE